MGASNRSYLFLWLVACYGLWCATASASLMRKSHPIEYRSSLLPRAVSVDGNCGAKASTTCLGSEFGDCCGQLGYCGSTNVYCGDGCQTDYGTCGDSSISTDGSCGGSKGLTCLGSLEGDCCSERGFCGKTSVYCGDGCQSGFGTCGAVDSSKGSNDEPAASSTLKTKASPIAGSTPKSTDSDVETATSSTVKSKTSPTAGSTSKSTDSDDAPTATSTSESTGLDDGPAAKSTSDSTDASADGGEGTQGQDDGGGMSTGTKIGLGVGASVIIIGALGAWMFLWGRRRGAGTGARYVRHKAESDAGLDENGGMSPRNEPHAQVPLIILIVGGIGSRIQIWGRRLGAGVQDEDKRGMTPTQELAGREIPVELAGRM